MLFNKNNSIKKSQMDIIYGSDEKTRRAIDGLYVSKKERTKMVVGLTLLALLVGFGAGYYVSLNTATAEAKANVVEVKVSPELKVEPQS